MDMLIEYKHKKVTIKTKFVVSLVYLIIALIIFLDIVVK